MALKFFKDKIEYIIIIKKQKAVTKKEKEIPTKSESQPCKGVISAPPNIAIIKPEAPTFLSSGRTLSREIP